MPQTLPFYPDLPAFDYQLALDDVQYRFRFTWNDLRASWYLGLDTADGTPLLAGKRIVPYTSHTRGLIRGGPPGILTALGGNPYARSELSLLYIPEAEIGLLPSAVEDDGRIVLVL